MHNMDLEPIPQRNRGAQPLVSVEKLGMSVDTRMLHTELCLFLMLSQPTLIVDTMLTMFKPKLLKTRHRNDDVVHVSLQLQINCGSWSYTCLGTRLNT